MALYRASPWQWLDESQADGADPDSMILTAGEWVMSLLQPATARIVRRRRLTLAAAVAAPLVIASILIAFRIYRAQSSTRTGASPLSRR